MRLNRHPQPRERGNLTGMAGHRDANLLRPDEAACRLDPGDAASVRREPGDLAVLDNVDTARIGATGKPPRHRIVTRNPGTRLQQTARYRKPCGGREVHDR